MPASRSLSSRDIAETFLPPAAATAVAGIAVRAAAARRRAGLTLAAVAGRTGLSPAYLSQIESGSANPTVRTLAQLAAALEVDLATLFGAADDAEPAGFGAYFSPAALAVSRAGHAGVWDLTAAGSRRLSARLVHGDAVDHAVPVAHAGEEFVVVIRGRCRLHVDGTARMLRVGDACHFSALQTHHLSNVSPDLTVAVVMSEGDA